jgi:glycine/D-amino acid oxidase-like deaminating enzyme
MPADPALSALAAARPGSFWLDDAPPVEPAPALAGRQTADLAVVGGGYSGLWTALHAVRRHPGRRVVLLEARECGWAASGRNGGFVEASLTHGLGNGLARWPDELPQLEELGLTNLAGLVEDVRTLGIAAQLEHVPTLAVATAPWQLADLAEEAEVAPRYGHDVELLDADGARKLVDSPTYLGGLVSRGRSALVHPARLARGLREACARAGVVVHEHTRVTALERDGAGLRLRTDYGELRAPKVALATSAFPPLLRRLRAYVVPVYDYALVTEPLTGDQRAALGWAGRHGISDAGNQFHYYRLTADGRVLWGGYDAVYHWRNGLRDELDRRPETFRLLARQFLATFPQLEGIRFSHAWGGVIDTCSRFSAFFGTAYDGRLAYAAGYTGLGVAATRFGAQVVLDLLDGAATERTELAMVRSKPLPFPPEPLRSAGINLTRWSLARADRTGRRNAWLRALDRLGMGYDS